MFQLKLRGNEVQRDMVIAHRAFPRAQRALLDDLSQQALIHANDLSSGGNASPGSYPIPVRTGRFKRGFDRKVGDRRAVVFNDSIYAQALHRGFRPYGNPHARVIPPRQYFDDALKRIDVDRALTVFDVALGAP